MDSSLWNDAGTWIALGVTVLSLVVGGAMSLVFRRILRQPPPPPSTPPTAQPQGPKTHE